MDANILDKIVAFFLPAPEDHDLEIGAAVRFVVTFPPGGGLDLVARIAAQGLVERWGQQVVVDNRIGAGGTIGTAVAAKAPPDGYPALFVSSSHTINPAVHRTLPYDTERDFDPVTRTTLVPHLLVVHPSFPARSVKELIALAKAKPGGITYASGGVGSSTHLAGELLKSLAGIDLVHVPYKGIGPALNDVVSGQIPVTISSVPSVIGQVRAGRLRALGVTGSKRTKSAPEYPPIAEAGVPGYEAAGWHGVLVPRGTPTAIVTRLQRDIAAVLTAEAGPGCRSGQPARLPGPGRSPSQAPTPGPHRSPTPSSPRGRTRCATSNELPPRAPGVSRSPFPFRATARRARVSAVYAGRHALRKPLGAFVVEDRQCESGGARPLFLGAHRFVC